MAGTDWTTKARGAMTRYRVMAYVTGVMLLVLCAEIVVHYVVRPDEHVLAAIEWIPKAHGFVYFVYAITVADLWSRLRWGYGRFITMMLGGVVPAMSFVLERRVHADADAQVATGHPADRRTVRAPAAQPH